MEDQMFSELTDGIRNIMEDRTERIILYGSVARGTHRADSDVDIAVIMYGEMDSETEDRLSSFIVEMNLCYDKVFSVIDINYDTFQKWKQVTPFYQNILNEGVVLWKAA